MLLRGLLIGALLITAMAGTASAGAINLNQWYGFLWAGVVESPLPTRSCNGNCFPPQGVIDAPVDSPWTISGPITLRVLDFGNVGDQFEVFDNAVSVGITSTPGDAAFCGPSDRVEDCWAIPNFSKGTFDVGGGAHSITIFLVTCGSDTCSGGASFVAEPAVVPLPPTVWLLGTGLAGLGGRRWLRRKIGS